MDIVQTRKSPQTVYGQNSKLTDSQIGLYQRQSIKIKILAIYKYHVADFLSYAKLG